MSDLSERVSQPPLPSTRRQRLRWAQSTVARIGGVTLAVVIVGAYFSARTNGAMLVSGNLLTILRGLSSIAIMGFGLTLVIIAAEIDLSFAAVYGLSTNIVAVLWVTHSVSVYVAILVAFAAGLAGELGYHLAEAVLAGLA